MANSSLRRKNSIEHNFLRALPKILIYTAFYKCHNKTKISIVPEQQSEIVKARLLSVDAQVERRCPP